ncbi:hypothetical protein K438DRAFT_1954260 [Mycena galopus ATCC 62051]|nr:hypothetical protein K438DRAFT_1954260 [Mycena galopus ATCC 62051]
MAKILYSAPAPPPPTAPLVSPVAGPSRASPPPRPSRSQTKKEGRSCKRTPTEPRADRELGRPASSQAPPEHPTIRIPPGWRRKFSNAYEEGDEETLRDFRVEFWEHLGSGSFHLLRPDPRTVDWMEARHSYSYRGFLSNLRPAQHTTRPVLRPVAKLRTGSEDDGPVPKKRKTSRAGRGPSAASSPEVIMVEDEEMPAAVDDMRNYDLDGDLPMPPVDPSIATDPNNYDVKLEPAPPVVPPEQQASSSRTTLDNLPPVASEPALHFLGFRLRPIEEFSAAARPTFVDEIVQWAIEGKEDETQVESTLLFMSAIFSQAGNTLGQRRRNGKGKARAVAVRIIFSFLPRDLVTKIEGDDGYGYNPPCGFLSCDTPRDYWRPPCTISAHTLSNWVLVLVLSLSL